MLLTSGYNFEGYEIISYLGHKSSQVVLGTGFLSSFNAAVSDIFGSRSSSYEEKLDSAEGAAKDRLVQQAKKLGGNAIIGIDVDYTTFSSDIIGVIVSGTIVKVEKKMPESEEETKRVPNMEYNLSLPFRISDVVFYNTDSTGKAYISLGGKSYTDKEIKGLEVSITFKTIFNNVIEFSNIAFVDIHKSDEDELSTETSSIELDNNIFKSIEAVSIRVNKCMINGQDIIAGSTAQNKEIDSSTKELWYIRKYHGNDAVVNAHKTDNGWVCYCGMENADNEPVCTLCGRSVETICFSSGNKDLDAFHLQEYLADITALNDAKEIYEYLQNVECSDENFKFEILPEIKKIAGMERMYGTMKDSDIKKLEELCQSEPQ